jgi:hypothetical protein
VVLQKDVPGSCSETYPPLSPDSKQVHGIKVENDSVIDKEENPVPLTYPDIKDTYEVSCVCLCLSAISYILLVSRIVYAPNSYLSVPPFVRIKRPICGEWIVKSCYFEMSQENCIMLHID